MVSATEFASACAEVRSSEVRSVGRSVAACSVTMSKRAGLLNMPKEDRDVFRKLEEEGHAVEDLMEEIDDLPAPGARKPVQKTAPTTSPKLKTASGKVTKKKKKPTVKPQEALLTQLLERLAVLEARDRDVRPAPPAPVQSSSVRVPTPGKRGSFAFFASKVESYATITNIPREKWVAVALQCMEERPCKVWGTYTKKRKGKDREVK